MMIRTLQCQQSDIKTLLAAEKIWHLKNGKVGLGRSKAGHTSC